LPVGACSSSVQHGCADRFDRGACPPSPSIPLPSDSASSQRSLLRGSEAAQSKPALGYETGAEIQIQNIPILQHIPTLPSLIDVSCGHSDVIAPESLFVSCGAAAQGHTYPSPVQRHRQEAAHKSAQILQQRVPRPSRLPFSFIGPLLCASCALPTTA